MNASSGAVAQRLDYDEWGFVLSDTSPGFQPFGFAGGLYDHQTGLVRFALRWALKVNWSDFRIIPVSVPPDTEKPKIG